MAVFQRLYPQPTIKNYLVLLIVIVGIYWGVSSFFSKVKKALTDVIKKRFPKIGILNGCINGPEGEYKCEKKCTEVTSGMWNLELKRSLANIKFKKIKMISVSQLDHSFTIIINPFGDVFPEIDPKMHTTFYAIRDYIKNGGIFVCTGGAFFIHHNTINSPKSEWAIKSIVNGVQSLKESLFYFTFGAETTGNEYIQNQLVRQEPIEIEIYQKEEDKIYTGNIQLPQNIKRFRALTSGTSDYIPFIRQKNDESFPIAAIPYGKGYIIHAGIDLSSDSSNEFKILVSIIKNLLTSKFKNL